MTTSERFRITTPASLGTAIRHFRRRAGLSQAELSRLTGIPRTYLSELEGGSQTEQVRRMLRILNRLGVRIVLEEDK
jgi:transcriptional regulator with XRE-family HTH domain